MGITKLEKQDLPKKEVNFGKLWENYGTFAILVLMIIIFGVSSPEYFLTGNNITQIFTQSSVNVLIGMGVFFAILIAGIDLSVGSILAFSGMVTAKLMIAGVDPVLAALLVVSLLVVR
ncbi:ribose ABC transport system permease protein RbsC [Vibrio ponticus]|nr:ribose ABC transport system permease protein RbsC [Vibrio ponticus]